MADVITRFKLETTQYDSKLRDSVKSMKDMVHMAELAGKDFKEFSDKAIESARALGEQATGATNAKEKVRELVKAYNEMADTYNLMSDTMKKSEGGKALAESLTTLQGRITEAKKELYNMGQTSGETGGILGKLKEKFVLNIDAMKLFSAGLTVGKKTLDVAKDAFFQSESNIDEWGRTVKSAEAAYDVFLNTLNSGNWANFFSNLSTAIQGARDLYDALDRLGSIKQNNQAAIAIVQQQIAQLRLAKQQGENVDDQLKAATSQLATLQKQSVYAGKKAGAQAVALTIANAYNTSEITPGKIGKKSLATVTNEIITQGQAAFDKYKKINDTLEARTLETRTTTTTNEHGITIQTQELYHNYEKLNKEERQQLALAKAITEGETRIQKGIGIYAQAVTEGTAAAREEFKGNRYALQGSGRSGGGGRGGGGGTKTVQTQEQLNSQQIQELTQEYLTASDERKAAIREEIKLLQDENKEIQRLRDEATGKIVRMNVGDVLPNNQGQIGQQLGNQFDKKIADSVMSTNLGIGRVDELTAMEDNLKRLTEAQKEFGGASSEVWQIYQQQIDAVEARIEGFKGGIKNIQQAANTVGTVVSAIGQAFNSIEDPAAKVMGTIAEAIAQVALGYGTATAQSASMGPWAWIAFAATATAQMIAMINSIHSATGFANGGIVPGNSLSGDNLSTANYGINSGELILNKAQQGNLASSLQGSGFSNLNLTATISGEQIRLALNNNSRRRGRGEYVTSNRIR
jgi:hypothetical protein